MYLIDEKSLTILNEIRLVDKDNFIDWEKTKEKFTYKNARTNFWLFDIKHGWFEITKSNYRGGRNHPKRTKYCKKTPEEHFNIMRLLDKDNFIDWEKTKERFIYINNKTKIELYDNKHGWYKVVPYAYKQGKRHFKRQVGINLSEPCILYILKLRNLDAHKIGITTKSIEKRYTKKERMCFDTIFEMKFETGYEAKKIEDRIKIINTNNQIDQELYPMQHGYTETFLNVDLKTQLLEILR